MPQLYSTSTGLTNKKLEEIRMGLGLTQIVVNTHLHGYSYEIHKEHLTDQDINLLAKFRLRSIEWIKSSSQSRP